jgi:monoamine oxidase
VAHDAGDVIVVGAGLSGLTAAVGLADAGLEVTVVEARDRVGGRLKTVPMPGTDHDTLDVGGQWVGPEQDRINALLDELALDRFRTHEAGAHLVDFAGRLRRYRGRIPRISPAVLLDVQRAQSALERAGRRLPMDEPWLGRGAEAADAQTFASWLARHTLTPGARRFFRVVTGAVFAAEPEELSALWVQFYVRAAGGLDLLIDTGGGAQQDRIVGGTQQIAQRLADRLGGRVILDAPVTEVEWTDRDVRVRAGGRLLRAARAIIALPPPLAGGLAYQPGLPTQRTQLTQRMPMGAVIKVMAVYDTPFWRDAGLSGQAASDRLPLSVVFDNSPSSGSPGVLLGFLEGRHATDAAALSTADRRKLVLDCFTRYFGDRAGRPEHYVEQDWTAERYSGGCYGAFTTPGTLSRFGTALRRPVGSLHWAGTETATRWTGYMDGAIEAGQRTAAEVLTALRDAPTTPRIT